MEITFEKFMELLRGYGTAVNAETYRSLLRYGGEGIQFSLEHGCAVMVEDYVQNGHGGIYIGVYPASPDGDIALATEEQIQKAKEYFNIYDDPEVYIKSAVVSSPRLPEKWNSLYGWRCFACQGREIAPNPHIRKLALKDALSIKALLEPYQRSKDVFESKEAKNLCGQADNFEEMTAGNGCSYYGYYEGDELCGIASACSIEELKAAWLLDVFVASKHRNKGIGKALVSCALRQWPDRKWIYQSERDNVRSIALAESLGFTFEGAALEQSVKPD